VYILITYLCGHSTSEFVAGDSVTAHIAESCIEAPIDGKEAGKFLKLHAKTVERFAREGRIPAHRIGNKFYRFFKSELYDWLKLCDNGISQSVRVN